MTAGGDPAAARLGRTVRRLRLRSGLTRDGLASAAELSASVVAQVEGGAGNPTLRVLSAIATALGVTPAALLDERTALLRHVSAGALPRRTLDEGRVGVVARADGRGAHHRREELLLLGGASFRLGGEGGSEDGKREDGDGELVDVDIMEGEGRLAFTGGTLDFSEGDLIVLSLFEPVVFAPVGSLLRMTVIYAGEAPPERSPR